MLLFGPWNIKWEIWKHFISSFPYIEVRTSFSIFKCSVLFQTPPEINDSKPCGASIINLCWFLGNSDLQNVYLVHTELMHTLSVALWLLALWVNEPVLVWSYIYQNVQYASEHIVVGTLFILLVPLFILISKRDDLLFTKKANRHICFRSKLNKLE